MQEIFHKFIRQIGTLYKRHELFSQKAHVSTRELKKSLERLRNKNGVFIAAPSSEYEACWIRDQLYSTLCYFYLGEIQKFREGVQVVFKTLHKHREKIEHVICDTPTEGYQYIHAKYDAQELNEITHDWGHHQLDAIGLFMYIVGFAKRNGIEICRSPRDKELIQLLVQYLTSVRYWEFPDHGMWEEGIDLHSSSIGAVVAGLTLIKEEKIAVVPESLIVRGHKTLHWLLPNESPHREVDMALLTLLWPYNVISPDIRDEILQKIESTLVQSHGLNRYLGDNYYRSHNGISAEWTMGFFWLSIIYSKKGDKEKAQEWFHRGCAQITLDGHIPELYQNGLPNDNTPLAWAHSMAIIATKKLGN
jgi:GH15 family glucan-1,4-alpha-glucosidase